MQPGDLQPVSTDDPGGVGLEELNTATASGGFQRGGAIGNGDDMTHAVATDVTGSEARGFALSTQNVALSVFLFVFAGILEIGGGYLFWKGLRGNKTTSQIILFCILGSLVLTGYGIVPTFQPMESFGRTFAIYGGFFILLSFLWGYVFERTKMDAGDLIGCAISMVGVLVIWFYPR